MADIFISYASEDRQMAQAIASALAGEGTVWWDRKITPGKRFEVVIREELGAAKCALVLWSKDSIRSDWVKDEADEAAKRNILVPVLIDEVEIPFGFRQIQAARLINWDGAIDNPDFVVLLAAVHATLGPAAEPIDGAVVPRLPEGARSPDVSFRFAPGAAMVRLFLLLLIGVGLFAIRFLQSGGLPIGTLKENCEESRQYCAEIKLGNLEWDTATDDYKASIELTITSPPRQGPEINDVRFRLQSRADWFDYLKGIPETQADWQPAERLAKLTNPEQMAVDPRRALYRDIVILKRSEIHLEAKRSRGPRLFPFDASLIEVKPEGCTSDQLNRQAFLCARAGVNAFSPSWVSLQSDEPGLDIYCDEHSGLCTIRRNASVVTSAALLFLLPAIFFGGTSTAGSMESILLRTGGLWVSFAAARSFLPAGALPFPTLLDLAALLLFVGLLGFGLVRDLSKKGDNNDAEE